MERMTEHAALHILDTFMCCRIADGFARADMILVDVLRGLAAEEIFGRFRMLLKRRERQRDDEEEPERRHRGPAWPP
jgi:hypothetical protein